MSVKNIGRVVVFILAVGAVAGAALVTASVLMRSGSETGDGSGISLGVCGLSAPDKLALRVYLEARAAELERPAGESDTPVGFTISPGESVAQVAERLASAGLVSDAELFRRYVQYHGLDAGIEAGEFTLRQTMTIPEIAQALQQGQRAEQVVTIREGLRLEEIAAEVGRQTTISEQEFLALVTAGWRELGLEAEFGFLSQLPAEATLEGFLFPDTYRLDRNAEPADLLRRMLENFARRVTPELRAAAANQGLDLYDMVTLASIVEREAVLAEERPVIAGVFYNRLRADYLLESCPTVQYSLGTPTDWWPSLTLDDLDRDLPTSTYQHKGLPPGPICSPGLASLEAVAYPAQTEFLFFLADCTKNDGSHLFSVTLEEHLANFQRCGAASLP